jgi:hypothetical protein
MAISPNSSAELNNSYAGTAISALPSAARTRAAAHAPVDRRGSPTPPRFRDARPRDPAGVHLSARRSRSPIRPSTTASPTSRRRQPSPTALLSSSERYRPSPLSRSPAAGSLRRAACPRAGQGVSGAGGAGACRDLASGPGVGVQERPMDLGLRFGESSRREEADAVNVKRWCPDQLPSGGDGAAAGAADRLQRERGVLV